MTGWASTPARRSIACTRRVTGRRITQKLRAGAPEGAHQIRWQVVSADGHPISGVVNCCVGEAAADPRTANQFGAAGSTSPPAEQVHDAATTAETAGLTPLQLYDGAGLGGAAVGVGVFLLISSLIRRRTAAT